MNKLLLELSAQAYRECKKIVDDDGKEVVLTDQWLKKYGELVVKKCAYLVEHQQRTTGQTTHAKMLCKDFEIDYKDEDYFDQGNDFQMICRECGVDRTKHMCKNYGNPNIKCPMSGNT